jgi:hypothetical protein
LRVFKRENGNGLAIHLGSLKAVAEEIDKITAEKKRFEGKPYNMGERGQ